MAAVADEESHEEWGPEPECAAQEEEEQESMAAKMLAEYFQGSGMSLQEYFQFPEMRNIRNPVHEYFRLGGSGGDSKSKDIASDWIQEGTLAIEEAEDGWLVLGAEHKELARIAVSQGGNPHYYARAWDGSYIGPLLRTTSFMLRTGAGLTMGVANITGSLICSTAAMVYQPGPRIPPPDAPWSERFVEESVEVDGNTWYFRVWLPHDLKQVRQEQQGLPVFTMLHGFKECGWDNWWQTNAGLALLLQGNWWSKWFPGILVLPQLPRRPWEEQWWQHWRSPQMQRMALACVEAAVRKYGGDRRKLYLLGESLGAEGAWHLAASKPGYFAALGCSCGSVLPYDWASWTWGEEAGDEFDSLAEGIGRATPMWFCHGAKDDFVPIEQSRRFHEALLSQRKRQSLGSMLSSSEPGEVVFKEYVELDHHVWDEAYTKDSLIEWLLSKRL